MSEENEIGCRYCFELSNEQDNQLISPCDCAGTQRFVHKQCLFKWQLSQLNDSLAVSSLRRVPSNNETESHTRCGICNAQFRNVPVPSRVNVLEYQCGLEIVNALKMNSLLVATASSSSRTVPDAMFNNLVTMFLNLKRNHWKYSVYFIFSIDTSVSDYAEIRGLNFTRLMDGSVEKPIPDEVLLCKERYNWISILHYNGGPVLWSMCRLALCIIPISLTQSTIPPPNPHSIPIDSIPPPTPSTSAPANDSTTTSVHSRIDSDEVVFVPMGSNCLIMAKFLVLIDYLESIHNKLLIHRVNNTINNADTVLDPTLVTVYSFSGFAQWNRIQLLGEIRRGSWGVVDPSVGLQALPSIESDMNNHNYWNQYNSIAIQPTATNTSITI